MKNWKTLLLTVFSFFAIGSMVVFNSCEKEPCMVLKCENGGACSNGFCQCPVGWEGAECTIPASSRFLGKWKGDLRCDNFPMYEVDVTVLLKESPNRIQVKLPFGNTSVLIFEGEARTPETHFVTHVDDDVDIHAYVRVDGDMMWVYLETIDKKITNRQICRFSGGRLTYE